MKKTPNRSFIIFIYKLATGFLVGSFIGVSIISSIFRNDGASMCVNIKNSQRNNAKMFLGVMTTRRYLSTRADAIYKTWGRNIPGKLAFFVGSGEDIPQMTSLPVIVLPDVKDDEYPPQNKSFAMLRYMWTYHSDFRWFVRLDDDVFVDVGRLERLLNDVDSSKQLYMGRPGTGVVKEKGKLGLHMNTPYCLGGSGVILSLPTLTALVTSLPVCLKDTVTQHEDTELGRCIYKATGLSCTLARQFDFLFMQDFTDKTGLWALSLMPNRQRAITYHPIKEPAYVFALHITLLSKRINTKMRHSEKLEKEVNTIIMSGFTSSMFEDSNHRNCSVVPCDIDSGKPWACVIRYDIYSLYGDLPREAAILRDMASGILTARRALAQYMLVMNVTDPEAIKVVQVSYQRVVPLKGAEHVIVLRNIKSEYLLFRILRRFDVTHFRELPQRIQKHNSMTTSTVIRGTGEF